MGRYAKLLWLTRSFDFAGPTSLHVRRLRAVQCGVRRGVRRGKQVPKVYNAAFVGPTERCTVPPMYRRPEVTVAAYLPTLGPAYLSDLVKT